jgi:hypothetical protein
MFKIPQGKGFVIGVLDPGMIFLASEFGTQDFLVKDVASTWLGKADLSELLHQPLNAQHIMDTIFKGRFNMQPSEPLGGTVVPGR